MKRILSIVIVIILTMSASSCNNTLMKSNDKQVEIKNMDKSIAEIENTDEPVTEIEDSSQAMIIIGDEFGNTYFDMKKELEIQGFLVVTVGVGNKKLISSCPNHENIQVTPDINIIDINDENIIGFSLVFIPAGKHHRTIQFSEDVKRILTLGKESSLYISSVCAGNIVLASVEGLIEGYEIACSTDTKEYIDSAGGISKNERVVVDGCFVTGNSGGGKTGGGHEIAPTKELAEKLKSLVDETSD